LLKQPNIDISEKARFSCAAPSLKWNWLSCAIWSRHFSVGLVAFGFRIEKRGYRFASVTFAIIVLIPRAEPPWIVAIHRFLEVAIGILVALAVVALCLRKTTLRSKLYSFPEFEAHK
jgi:hypothetical protein